MKRERPSPEPVVFCATNKRSWTSTMLPCSTAQLHAWGIYERAYRVALRMALTLDELTCLIQLRDAWPATGDPACAPLRIKLAGITHDFPGSLELLDEPVIISSASKWKPAAGARAVRARCEAVLKQDAERALLARCNRRLKGGASVDWCSRLRKRCVLTKAMAASWKCQQLRVRRALRTLEAAGIVAEDGGSDRFRFAPERLAVAVVAAHLDAPPCEMPEALRFASEALLPSV